MVSSALVFLLRDLLEVRIPAKAEKNYLSIKSMDHTEHYTYRYVRSRKGNMRKWKSKKPQMAHRRVFEIAFWKGLSHSGKKHFPNKEDEKIWMEHTWRDTFREKERESVALSVSLSRASGVTKNDAKSVTKNAENVKNIDRIFLNCFATIIHNQLLFVNSIIIN